jgi:hypothetical protein
LNGTSWATTRGVPVTVRKALLALPSAVLRGVVVVGPLLLLLTLMLLLLSMTVVFVVPSWTAAGSLASRACRYADAIAV